MSYIYKIINDINGKLYIGKTNYTIEKRFQEHINDSIRKRNEKRPLYEAMNKYGIEHFYIEEIEKVKNDEQACIREQYWIEKLRTYIGFKDCNGYNATLGGDSKKYKNFDIKDIIKMYYDTYDVELISEKFNLEHTYINKILKQNGVKVLTYQEVLKRKYGKKIYQVELNTLNVLNIFQCKTDANLYLGKNKNNGAIFDACTSRRGHHHAHKYDWYYEEDYLKLKEEHENNKINQEELVV